MASDSKVGETIFSTPSDVEVTMSRVFSAPRELVFEAHTNPEHVQRWLLGPCGWTMPVCEIDLRPGGEWHYVWRSADGEEMEMRGVYREIAPPERLVNTESWGPEWPETLVTLTLTEDDGRTLLTSTVRYPSKEARDAAIATGMTEGAAQSYDRLAAHLPTLAGPSRETTENTMDSVADRYRRRADDFERRVDAVSPTQWTNRSPCAKWTARDVVDHIIAMHAVILRPLGRELSAAPSVTDDPLGAVRAARADVEALLDDPVVAATECDAPAGRMTVEQHIDQVPSDDLVIHGWDLARATGQDDTMDPDDVARLWAKFSAIPAELLEKYRDPSSFGGVEVFGPEVKVPEDAPLQDRLLGLIGRDPR